MDKQHLRKRHNAWWERIRIPTKAKGILGKTELWKNLKTTDLAEANRKMNKEIGLMNEKIDLATQDYEGIEDKLSKEVQISKYIEYLREAKITRSEKDADTNVIKLDLLGGKLDEIYARKEAESILYSYDPQWEGKEPNTLANENFIKSYKLTDQSYKLTDQSYKLTDQSYPPLSLESKKFLAEELMNIKSSSYRRKLTHIDQFIKWTGNRDTTRINKKIVGDYVTSIIKKNMPAPAKNK